MSLISPSRFHQIRSRKLTEIDKMCVVHVITTENGCYRLYRGDVDCCTAYKAAHGNNNNKSHFKPKVMTWKRRGWNVEWRGLNFALGCHDVDPMHRPKGFDGCKKLQLRRIGETMLCSLCDYEEVISKILEAITEQGLLPAKSVGTGKTKEKQKEKKGRPSGKYSNKWEEYYTEA